MRLLNKEKATLLRVDPENKGYYDSGGKWINTQIRTASTISCTIQPYTALSFQKKLPEGVSQKDCRVIWTETDLQIGSEYSFTEADIIRFNGIDFEVFEVGYWNGPRRIKGCNAILVRKDKK